MNSYKVEAMFPQPFSVEHLTLDVKSIADFCYNVKNNKDVGREISNAGGWQSNNVDIKSIENVEFTKLLDEIGIAINKVSSDIGIIPELDISNLWININQYNNHNIPHFHHGSILSGTFYVKIPENAGNIKFKNPVAPLMESYLNFWHFKESELRYFPWLVSNLIFPCEENMMIIFPSWIEHSVDRNLNVNEDRISISFNTKRKEEK